MNRPDATVRAYRIDSVSRIAPARPGRRRLPDARMTRCRVAYRMIPDRVPPPTEHTACSLSGAGSRSVPLTSLGTCGGYPPGDRAVQGHRADQQNEVGRLRRLEHAHQRNENMLIHTRRDGEYAAERATADIAELEAARPKVTDTQPSSSCPPRSPHVRHEV